MIIGNAISPFRLKNSLVLASQIGDLLDDDFQRASLGSDYTLVTTNSTAAIVSNELQFYRPTQGGFLNYLTYDPIESMLNNFYASITYKVTALSTTSGGVAIGVWGFNSTVYRHIFGYYNTKTDAANYKKIQIFQNDSGVITTKKSSATTLTASVNDIITISVSMVNLVFSVTVLNVTTGLSISDSYTFGLASPELIQTSWKPAIWNNGGNWNIQQFTFGSTEYKNSKLCMIGDSTSQGVGATTYANSLQGLMEVGMIGNNRLTKSALGSAITDDAVLSNTNLSLIKSRYFLIMLGTNDIVRNIGGDGLANAQANLITIVNNIVSIGKTPIIMTPLARNAASMATIASWIISTFTSHKVIDLYSFTKDGATSNLNPAWTADGTHLNDTGQAAVYAEIISQAPEIL